MALGLGFLGFDYAGSTDYFDLAFINSTRAEMSKGSGAMYEDPVTSPWGSGVASDLKKAALAVYYFVVSLDLRDIRSVRQLMALPEVLAFLVLIPVLFRGAWDSWARVRGRSFPLLLFAAALIVVYGSATTNLGAMFRWRMQAMPLLLVFVAHGLALRPWHPLARLALRVSSRLAGEHPYLPARKEDWRIPGRARSSRSQPVLR